MLAVSSGQPISISDDPDAVALIGSSQDADSEKMKEKPKRGAWMGTRPTELEQSIIEDLRNRVQLSGATLPSFSFYTFVNTQWVLDMAKLGHPTGKSILQGENDTAPSEQGQSPNSGKRYHTFFQGHLGPVHSATLSPLGDFNLSSSADTTDRYNLIDYHFTADFSLSANMEVFFCFFDFISLQMTHISAAVCLWRTELNANLVCYKGHNYPVWDAEFSPVGHLLARASHDHTARIWSMQRIQPLRVIYVMLICEGSLLASGSADCTVKLWDVTTTTKAARTEGSKSGNTNRFRLLKTLPTKSTPVYTLRYIIFLLYAWDSRNLLFAAGALAKSQ
ncbi:hypothetical protein SADUNF_Sadunf18G0014800 [Salix dunnii]|uniref:Uncharacterized protein n=1 Tax=Salix dunnii TaxID=1413687 RepID=A0A835J3C3_9ROSI|nr:hypothetical protein SADUNF_Sadunf18G0014800 [Salix dunnii]